MGRYPSGQRGLTVNQLAKPSVVQIRPCPLRHARCYHNRLQGVLLCQRQTALSGRLGASLDDVAEKRYAYVAVLVKVRINKLEEVAASLGLHIARVQRLCRNGELRSRKIGRRWYVLGRDLLPKDLTKAKGKV